MSETINEPLLFDAEKLETFCTALFIRFGLSPQDGRTVANNLVLADLRGVHSHGVSRMQIYTERLRRGLFKADARIRVERTAPATAVVDGDNGMGAVVGLEAMTVACRMAAEAGVGMVSVHNSNHFGTAAYYLNLPLARGWIGATCSNAPPTTAPFGGREPIVGTNPFAVGVPAGSRPAIVADMATSITARGNIILANQRQEEIPLGLALDQEGRPTTSPAAALLGALLPFGGPKGSALAILVEIFAGVLSGANLLKDIPDFYRELTRPSNFGHFFVAIDISRFMPADAFGRRIETMIGMLKACAPAAGSTGVLMPGEIEAGRERDRRAHGVPLTSEVVALLSALAEEKGVPMPAAKG